MRGELSSSHCAVLLIANTYLANVLPKNISSTFASATPEEIARIAQSNHIHPLIGRVLLTYPEMQKYLPRDLSIYFVEMYRANQERLAQSQDQLAEIGAAFAQAGISGIAMKGGGDVLDPLHDDPAIRFSGDVDVLVEEAHVARAEEILLDLGAQSLRKEVSREDEEANWRGVKFAEHHLPKIVHPDWQLPVEVHLMAGRGAINKLLPVTEVFARKVEAGDSALSVMSPEDRAVHLIAHADHHGGEVDLRAWIDWSALRKRCDRGEVRERLEAEGLAGAFDVFEVMADHLETPVMDAENMTWDGAGVRTSLQSFGDTKSRRRNYIFTLIKRKFGALLRSSEYRTYVLKNMMKPDWWKQVWITHRTKRRNQR